MTLKEKLRSLEVETIVGMAILGFGLGIVALFNTPPKPPSLPLMKKVRANVLQLRSHIFLGSGSATYIGDGLVLTAGHVCSYLKEGIYALDSAGKAANLRVLKVLENDEADLCVAKLTEELPGAQALEVVGPDTMMLGEKVMMASFSGGRYYSNRFGIVVADNTQLITNMQGQLVTMRTLVAQIPAEPGASGGPVINLQGKIVGIVSAASSNEPHTFFISAEVVHKFLASLKEPAYAPGN